MRAGLISFAFCVTLSAVEPDASVSYTDGPDYDKKPHQIESPHFHHPPPSKRPHLYLFPPPPLPSPPSASPPVPSPPWPLPSLPWPRVSSPPWSLPPLTSPGMPSPLSSRPLPAPAPPSSQSPRNSTPLPDPQPTPVYPPFSSPSVATSSISPSPDAVASPARQAESDQNNVFSSHPALHEWVVSLSVVLLCLVALMICVNTLIAVKSIVLTYHLRDMLRRSVGKQIQMSEPVTRPVVHESFC